MRHPHDQLHAGLHHPLQGNLRICFVERACDSRYAPRTAESRAGRPLTPPSVRVRAESPSYDRETEIASLRFCTVNAVGESGLQKWYVITRHEGVSNRDWLPTSAVGLSRCNDSLGSVSVHPWNGGLAASGLATSARIPAGSIHAQHHTPLLPGERSGQLRLRTRGDYNHCALA